MISVLRPRPHAFKHVRPQYLYAAHARHNSTRAVAGGDLIYEERGGARIFTLNRPKALNAISGEMFYSLIDTIGEWAKDPAVKVVLGEGEGRAFASGGDIKSVVHYISSTKDSEKRIGEAFLCASLMANWEAAQLEVPYVSFMDGITMGGGAGLALPGNIRIATPRTQFAMPECRIGYCPDVASSYWLTQLDGYIGTWLAMTSRDVFGREAYELGICTHYVSEASVPEIRERIALLPSPTAGEISALVSEYHLAGNAEPSSKANRDGRSTLTLTPAIRAHLDAVFSLPSLPQIWDTLGLASGLAPAVAEWARAQRALMAERGPTGMAVALENYHAAMRHKSLYESVRRDVLLAAGFAGPRRPTNDLVVGCHHTLTQKRPPPIPFEPPIARVHELTAELVRTNFCSPTPAAPDIPLTPRPEDVSTPHWGEFRRHGVPSEAAVRAAMKKGLAGEQLVDAVVQEKSKRTPELQQMARDIEARLAQPEQA